MLAFFLHRRHQWQNEKQSLCVVRAGMNPLNGWEDVQGVENGIQW